MSPARTRLSACFEPRCSDYWNPCPRHRSLDSLRLQDRGLRQVAPGFRANGSFRCDVVQLPKGPCSSIDHKTDIQGPLWCWWAIVFSEQIAVGWFLLQACRPYAGRFPAPYSSFIMGLAHVEENGSHQVDGKYIQQRDDSLASCGEEPCSRLLIQREPPSPHSKCSLGGSRPVATAHHPMGQATGLI